MWQYLPEKFTNNQSLATGTNFCCGAVAGCAATTLSYPFDVVRTRLVGQGEPKVGLCMYIHNCDETMNYFLIYYHSVVTKSAVNGKLVPLIMFW